MNENKELLEVKNLGITFFTDRGALPAVQEVNFKVHQGETLGVVGESVWKEYDCVIIDAAYSVSTR